MKAKDRKSRAGKANATTRRRVLQGMGGGALAFGAGVLAPGLARQAMAQDFSGKTVVFASWGGAYQEAQKVSYCDGFAERTGANVIQDGPVNYAKLRTMVEQGQPTWDVVDITIDYLYSASSDGLFEKIDTDVVDVSRIDDKFVHEYGIGNIVWSYNIGYNKEVFEPGKHPSNWAEFFDLERFPGTRSLRDRVQPMLEIALMADGVAPADLYPLDVDRAFRKLDEIKDSSIFWQTNSQSQQLLIDGEAGVGIINNGRIFDAVKDGAPLGIEWNQHMQSVDYLIVPKGSANIDIAMALINEMTLPEHQAKVANLMALAPTNPDAFAMINDEVSDWLPTNPDNAAKGFVVNADYWRDNYEDLAARWEEWKLS